MGTGLSLLTRVARAALPAAGLLAVVALHAAPAHPRGALATEARTLVLSDQARRCLALQFRAYPTEFLGCMIGDLRGGTVFVRRIAPADVDPAQSTATHVLPRQTCEAAGWVGTVGMIHTHPGGERCFYYFPGTYVASSDAQSFGLQAYPLDAIMCGDSVVWIARDLAERKLLLADRPAPAAPQLPPGNRVHAGSHRRMPVE